MPSLCPVCGRIYCFHSLEERGQTEEERDRRFTEEEWLHWRVYSIGSPELIELAQRNRHLES